MDSKIRTDAVPYTEANEASTRQEHVAQASQKLESESNPSEPILADQARSSIGRKEEDKLLKTLQASIDESSDEDQEIVISDGEEEEEEQLAMAPPILHRQQEEVLELGQPQPQPRGPGGPQIYQYNIQNMGDLHIGPRIIQNNVGIPLPKTRSKSSLSQKEIDHIKACSKSRRRIQETDIFILSGSIGHGWKEVGNGLKFDYASLDNIENDKDSLQGRVELMLLRWMRCRVERATVARLTKVLFNHREYDAIITLTP